MCNGRLASGIYIALGGNLGDRKKNLQQALDILQEEGIIIKKVSSFIETKAYGVEDQPDFLNAVAEISTEYAPLDLLRILLATEKKMGRKRLRHWGERNIDLDLIMYGDEVIDTEELILPHPDMQNRSFVLKPLIEIGAGNVIHPVLKESLQELLDKIG